MEIKNKDRLKIRMARIYNNIQGATREGLRKAAVLVEAESTILAPIEIGHLRGSTTISHEGGEHPASAISYKADYAAIVHESVGKNFKAPGTGPKFLERAVDENHAEIIKIIMENAKTGLRTS